MNFEHEFAERQKQSKIELFLEEIKDYDERHVAKMKDKGYIFKGYVEKTVSFIFGTVTFKRRRWCKNGKNYYPVDEYLGLKKRQRVSEAVLYEIVTDLPLMTFRGATEVMNQRDIEISTWVVVQARKFATRLLKERYDYRFYKEEKKASDKIQTDILHVEADGLRISTCCKKEERKMTDFSHFVVHTGKKEGKIQNFKEFYSIKSVHAKEQVVDYIYNNFDISEDTILYSRSDGGVGYTSHIFKEFCCDIGIKKQNHYHFWDRWHIFKYIADNTRGFPKEIQELLIKAVKTQDRSKLHLALDTMESLVVLSTEKQELDFLNFKKRMLYNFKYTSTAMQRGLPYKDIPVIEANHKKVTQRMKHRGMYWSIEGALTMIHIIIMKKKNTLKDLFYGEWRKEYEKFKEYDTIYHSRDIMNQSRKEGRQGHYIDKKHPSQKL